MNSMVVAILGGAAGGMLAAALATLLGRLLPDKFRKAFRTAMVVGFGLLASRVAVTYFENFNTTPGAIAQALVEDVDAGRLMRAWQSAEPASFATMVEQLSVRARSGADRTSIVNAARANMLAVARPRLMRMPDEQVIEMMQVGSDQFSELATSQPAICYPMFMGENYGDLTPFLSEGLKARELALLEAAFRNEPRPGRPILSGAAFQEVAARLFADLREAEGPDVDMLTGHASINGREARYCQLVANFFDRIASLPQSEAGAFARGLYAAAVT